MELASGGAGVGTRHSGHPTTSTGTIQYQLGCGCIGILRMIIIVLIHQ